MCDQNLSITDTFLGRSRDPTLCRACFDNNPASGASSGSRVGKPGTAKRSTFMVDPPPPPPQVEEQSSRLLQEPQGGGIIMRCDQAAGGHRRMAGHCRCKTGFCTRAVLSKQAGEAPPLATEFEAPKSGSHMGRRVLQLLWQTHTHCCAETSKCSMMQAACDVRPKRQIGSLPIRCSGAVRKCFTIHPDASTPSMIFRNQESGSNANSPVASSIACANQSSRNSTWPAAVLTTCLMLNRTLHHHTALHRL